MPIPPRPSGRTTRKLPTVWPMSGSMECATSGSGVMAGAPRASVAPAACLAAARGQSAAPWAPPQCGQVVTGGSAGAGQGGSP